MLRMIGVVLQPLILSALFGLVSYNLFTQERSVSWASRKKSTTSVPISAPKNECNTMKQRSHKVRPSTRNSMFCFDMSTCPTFFITGWFSFRINNNVICGQLMILGPWLVLCACSADRTFVGAIRRFDCFLGGAHPAQIIEEHTNHPLSSIQRKGQKTQNFGLHVWREFCWWKLCKVMGHI